MMLHSMGKRFINVHERVKNHCLLPVSTNYEADKLLEKNNKLICIWKFC